MRFLILAEMSDPTALEVFAWLRLRHSDNSVLRLTSEEVCDASTYNHRLCECEASSRMRIADGSEIQSQNLGVVLNRLRYLSIRRFSSSREIDRDYANAEMSSFLLSWLAAMPCPVVNPPSSIWLAGSAWHPFSLQTMAAEAGLDVLDLTSTSNARRFCPSREMRLLDFAFSESHGRPYKAPLILNQPGTFVEPVGDREVSLLVVGDRVLGQLPPELRTPSIRLVQKLGLDLAKVFFVESEGDVGSWKFAGLDPYPQANNTVELCAIVEFLERLSIPERNTRVLA